MSGQELSRLVAILADGLRVWVKRGEVALTEDQIFERARNQAASVMGAYFMVPHPEVDERVTPVAAIGHGYGCPCGRCPGEFVTGWPRAWATREQLQAMYDDGKPPGHLGTCRCDKCDTYDRKVRTQKVRTS